MTLYKFTNYTPADADEVNSNMNSVLRLTGLNTIRMLQDRSVSFSTDFNDGWGEAYIDADGRNNSVDSDYLDNSIQNGTSMYCGYPVTPYDEASRTSGTIDTGKWTSSETGTQAAGSTSINTKRFRIYSYSNDFSSTQTLTSNNEDALNTSNDYIIGGSYSLNAATNTNGGMIIKFGTVTILSDSANSTTKTGNFLLHIYYDGANWKYNNLGGSYSIFSPVDGEYQFTASSDEASGDHAAANIYVNFCGIGVEESLIYHTIPTGTFNTTINSSFLTILTNDWETGADIQYKITDSVGSGDSGWLNYNEVSNFTAFVNEPDVLTVKLIPKTTSPTISYPSIKGTWIITE